MLTRMKPSVLKAILKQAVSKPEAVARIQKARKAVNTKPSPAQADAGNYEKGHVHLHGLDISIENPKGSIRRGVSKSGTEWACKMFCDYGYLKRTTGADAEPVDCFIGEHPHSELVFCVDQMVNGKFDELKVMLGFLNAEDAKAGYLANYAPGWNGCGHVTPLTMEQFKSWLENGDETKPMQGQRMDSFHKKADGENYTCKGPHNTCPSCGCEERCKCGEKHHNHTEEVCAKCNASGGAKDLYAPPMKKADSERRENKLLRHKHEAKDLATCPECAHLFVHNKEPEISMCAVACPKCGSSVTQEHCGEKNGAALSVNKNEVVAPNAVQPMGLNTNAMHSMALSPHPTVFKDTRPVFTHGVQVQPSVPALPTAPQTPAVPVPPMIAKSAGLINGLRLGVDAAEFMMLANATKKKKEGEDADAEEINPEAEEHDMATNIADTIKQNPNVSMIDPHKKPSIIPLLQTAKAHSDAGRYDDKAAVMRSLFTTHGSEFEVDQDDGGTIVGVNHKPSNFKMHLPRNSVPPSLMNKSASKDKFSKPENPETFEKGKNWTLYAGGNDWENGITTCWVDTPDYHDGKERVWFDVDFSKFPNHDKSPSPSSEDGKAENERGNKAARAWLAAARSIKAAREDGASDSGNAWHDYFTEALQTPEMQPYVKSHGTERTKWQKVASTDASMLTMVPAEALAAIRAHGLLSGDELTKPENRHLLELARPDGDAERWLAEREDRKKNQPWNTAYAGPSALFGAADPDKITDQHPTKRFETVPVRIRLAQLLADHPDTKVHGSELIPFDENYDNFSEEQKDEFVQKRHHDLTAEELQALITQAQNPKEFWKHYHDPEGKTYAANVPHGQVITRTGKIDPKYLEFPDDEVEKQATTTEAPLTGPEAIMHALSQIDMTHLEKLAKDDIKSGKVTRRGKAVKTLNIIEGLRRNKLEPHHLMISKVPVLPPIFRPFSVAGGSFVPGDANELYKDLFTARDLYRDHQKEFGAAGAGEARLNLYNAVKACYGYGEPVNAKTKMRGVSGFLAKIVGSSPKHSWMLSKMISKPMDSVSRGVVAPNPNLGVDEIGIPEDHAWSAYAPHIQRKLVLSGQSPLDAIKSIKERDGQARRALELITTPGPHGRPVIYSRAPAWHKFSVISAWPKIIPGHIIQVNPYVTTGANMDFDGDFCIGKVLTLLPIALLSESLLTPEVTSALIRGMFKNLNIPTFNPLTHTLALTDLEDFPHGPLTNSKEGANGRIDFFQGIPGTMVIAYDEKTNKPVWAPVAFCSKHFQREVEIVTLRTKRQIVTDNDPRAVYAIDPAAGTLTPARFTPTEALEKKVVVPFVRNAQHVFDQAGKLDMIQITTNPECAFQHVKLDWDFGYFLGAMCGDGWWDKSDSEYLRKRLDMAGLRNLHVSDLKGYNAARVKQMLEKLPSVRESMTLHKHEFLKTDHPDRYGDTVRHSFNFKHSEELAVFLSQHLGGEGDENTAGSGNKKLPCFLVSTSQEFREGLLCGLIDTDGTACISNAKDKPQLMVAFTSTSLRLVRDVQFLCLTLGILTSISFSKTTTAGNTAWLLSMSSVDCKKNGCLAKLQSPWKRDAFLNTPVSTTHGNAGVGNTVVFPRHIAEKLLTEIASPKITKALRKIGGAQVEEKKAEQLIYQWAYQGAKDGYLTRNAARKVIAAVEAEYTARQTLVTVVLEECEEALNTGRLGSDTISRLRKAISYLAPHYGKQEKYSDGQRIASRLNSPKKTGRAGPKLLNGLIAWLRGAVLPAGVLEDSEIKAWIKIVDEETVAWSPVESVEKTGIREDGYDLTVPGYETFMAADGIILSNTLNVHVPATDDAVQEAKDKLMPTKMLFTIRNPDKIMPVIKHETILGLHSAVMAPAKQRHIFPSHAEALSAIKRGQIALSDEIDIAQPPEPLDAVKNACVSHMVLDYLLATAVHAASNSEEETDEMCKQASRWSQLLAAGKLSAGSIQRLLQPLGKLYTRPRQAIDPQVIAGEGTKFQQLIGIRNALKLPVHPPSLGIGPYFSGGADMANDAALLESRGMDFNKALGFLRNFPEMPGLKKVTDALKFHEQPIPTPKWNAPANLDPQAIYRGHGLPDVQVIGRKHVGVLHGTPEPSTAATYATAPAFGDPRLNVLPDHMGFLSTYKVSPTQVYQPDWTLNKGKAGHPIEHFRQPRTTPVTPDDMYETDVTHNELLNTQIVRARPSASPLFSTADIPQTPQWLKILQNIKRASESESLIPA